MEVDTGPKVSVQLHGYEVRCGGLPRGWKNRLAAINLRVVHHSLENPRNWLQDFSDLPSM